MKQLWLVMDRQDGTLPFRGGGCGGVCRCYAATLGIGL